MVKEDWIKETLTIHESGYPNFCMYITSKATVWQQLDKKNESNKILLQQDENMVIDVDSSYNKAILLKQQSSSEDKSIVLPEYPAFNKQWLKRYMTGPWKENEQGPTEKETLLERDMFRRISDIRKHLAEIHNVPPIHICSRQELDEICRIRPTTAASMMKIEGMSKKTDTLDLYSIYKYI